MFTPQEVAKKEFDKAVIGGYVMAAVDEFLAQLGQDYAALYKENAILKNKLKVLVDKVEEYRSTEDAMRMALLSAKKTAKEINDEAEERKEQILAEAENAAKLRSEQLRNDTAQEEAAFEAAKRRTAEYVAQLRKEAEQYVRALDNIYVFAQAQEQTAPAGDVAPCQQEDKREELIDETAKSIELSVAKILRQDISSEDEQSDDDTRAYELSGRGDKPQASDTRNAGFSKLKFGADYQRSK